MDNWTKTGYYFTLQKTCEFPEGLINLLLILDFWPRMNIYSFVSTEKGVKTTFFMKFRVYDCWIAFLSFWGSFGDFWVLKYSQVCSHSKRFFTTVTVMDRDIDLMRCHNLTCLVSNDSTLLNFCVDLQWNTWLQMWTNDYIDIIWQEQSNDLHLWTIFSHLLSKGIDYIFSNHASFCNCGYLYGVCPFSWCVAMAVHTHASVVGHRVR